MLVSKKIEKINNLLAKLVTKYCIFPCDYKVSVSCSSDTWKVDVLYRDMSDSRNEFYPFFVYDNDYRKIFCGQYLSSTGKTLMSALNRLEKLIIKLMDERGYNY